MLDAYKKIGDIGTYVNKEEQTPYFNLSSDLSESKKNHKLLKNDKPLEEEKSIIELLAIEMPNIDNCLDYLIECAEDQNMIEETDAVFTRIESNEGFT